MVALDHTMDYVGGNRKTEGSKMVLGGAHDLMKEEYKRDRQDI